MQQQDIESLSRRRLEIWCGAEHFEGEVDSIGAKLADLFEEKRSKLAESATGEARRERMRAARVEFELERLITQQI